MAETSAIEWTDATVNFWWGCTKVGPGCDHCYAESWAKRYGGGLWGLGVPRRRIKGAFTLLAKMNAASAVWDFTHHRRRRVFIQSMSDLFDTEVPVDWFAEAWAAVKACRDLEIQIVTKRLSVIEKRLAAIGETDWPKHAGLIISVVNQDEANRDVPRLLALKAKLGIPWVGLSIEPMLGAIDLTDISLRRVEADEAELSGLAGLDALSGVHWDAQDTIPGIYGNPDPRVDWVICGGESGANARPMHPDWARSLRDQCADAGVPFLFKQWGAWHPDALLFTDVEGRCPPPTMKIGKKAAGRLLDGAVHNGFPEVAA